MKKYTIEVTERQMNLIANACELSSRLRSGQFHELRDIFHDLECTLGGRRLSYDEEETAINSLKRLFGLQSGESVGVRESSLIAKELYEIYYLVRHFFAIREGESSNVYRNNLMRVTEGSTISIREK